LPVYAGEFIIRVNMLQKFIAALAVIFFLIPSLVSGAGKAAEKPQVIKLERFRKALWKVHVTVKAKPGDFLLDTGGGVTFLSEDYRASAPQDA
jgi:hypothetical protein